MTGGGVKDDHLSRPLRVRYAGVEEGAAMGWRRWIGGIGLALALAGCGYRFPVGEKLLPESYGPPFGPDVQRNLPPHPHNPALDERLAAADSAKNKHYRNHQACHAELIAAVKRRGGDEAQVTRISAIESMGYAEEKAPDRVHEYRCSDYVLSYRAWCRTGGHGGDHGKPEDQGGDHGKPEDHGAAPSKAPKDECKADH